MSGHQSCGCPMGEHRFGCLDALGGEPDREYRRVYLPRWTPEEMAEPAETQRAAEREATSWLETAA